MRKEQFKNLRIGDTVTITVHGKNRGKQGVVSDIVRGPGSIGIVYLTPIDCEFLFLNPKSMMPTNNDGLYGYHYWALRMAPITNQETAIITNTLVIKIEGNQERVEKALRELIKAGKKIAPDAKVEVRNY